MSQIVAPARRSPSPEVSQRRGGSPDKSSPIKHRRNKMQDPSLGPGPGSYALNGPDRPGDSNSRRVSIVNRSSKSMTLHGGGRRFNGEFWGA